MATRLKRPWSSASRPVSPPAIKRKKVASAAESTPVIQRSSTSIRIFSWNVNGVNALLQKQFSFDTKTDFPLRKFLKRHDWPHMLCLQEVKINSKDEMTQRQLRHAANAGKVSDEPTYSIAFSLPRDKYNATGFGGKVHGVATLIREDFSSHVVATTRPPWDLEGRVLIHELTDGLIVINGYWVNGTDNPYRNSDTGVVQGTRHDHKIRFHQHMLDEAMRFEQLGRQVMLIGDMNIARSRIDGHPNLRVSPAQHVKNRADFNDKFFEHEDGLKAVDVFRQLHGQKRKYTYYPRGCGWGESCDRVDLIIATDGLRNSAALEATDICDNPLDRGHSDHVPLWVQLDLSKIPRLSLSAKETIGNNDA